VVEGDLAEFTINVSSLKNNWSYVGFDIYNAQDKLVYRSGALGAKPNDEFAGPLPYAQTTLRLQWGVVNSQGALLPPGQYSLRAWVVPDEFNTSSGAADRPYPAHTAYAKKVSFTLR
jgi:hypothetical protein